MARLSELHEAYLSSLRKRGYSPDTIEAYASDFIILQRFLGRDDIPALQSERMGDYAFWLAEQGQSRNRKIGCGPRTVLRWLASASTFVQWLVERGDLKRNPFADFPRPKHPRRVLRAVSLEWLDAIFALPDQPPTSICGDRPRAFDSLSSHTAGLSARRRLCVGWRSQGR